MSFLSGFQKLEHKQDRHINATKRIKTGTIRRKIKK